MSQSLYYLAYTSKIKIDAALHDQTFFDIYQESNHNNSQIGVTGFLCFKDGKFFQFIEGEAQAIKELYAAIKRDIRHKQVTTLIEGVHNERYFDQWSMYCMNLDVDSEGNDMSEYFEKFDTYHWGNETPFAVIKDMQNYYNANNWKQDSRYQVRAVSYVNAQAAKMTKQHKPFLVLQTILFIAVIIVLGYFLIHELSHKI